MSAVERSLRDVPRARGSLLGRVAVSVLERVLPELEGGSLDVTLPGGTRRPLGSGPPVPMSIASDRLFRRLATPRQVGLGVSDPAGGWDADHLVGFFEREGFDGVESLFAVPRTTVRCPQPRLHRRQLFEPLPRGQLRRFRSRAATRAQGGADGGAG